MLNNNPLLITMLSNETQNINIMLNWSIVCGETYVTTKYCRVFSLPRLPTTTTTNNNVTTIIIKERGNKNNDNSKERSNDRGVMIIIIM